MCRHYFVAQQFIIISPVLLQKCINCVITESVQRCITDLIEILKSNKKTGSYSEKVQSIEVATATLAARTGLDRF